MVIPTIRTLSCAHSRHGSYLFLLTEPRSSAGLQGLAGIFVAVARGIRTAPSDI